MQQYGGLQQKVMIRYRWYRTMRVCFEHCYVIGNDVQQQRAFIGNHFEWSEDSFCAALRSSDE